MNTVSLRTIHKAKGLQYKVIFVSNLNHQFNTDDEKTNLVFDRDKGIALPYRFYKQSDQYFDVLCALNHLYREIVKAYMHKQTVNESMRLLYVALTRAQGKIILTGVFEEEKDLLALSRKVQANDANDLGDWVVFHHELRHVNNYLDWILMSAMRHETAIHDLVNVYPDLKKDLKSKRRIFNALDNEETQLACSRINVKDYDDVFTHPATHKRIMMLDQYHNVAQYYEYRYPYEDHDRSIAITTLQALSNKTHFNYLSSTSFNRKEA